MSYCSDLGYTQLTGNLNFLANLTQLAYLNLKGDCFYGPLPSSINPSLLEGYSATCPGGYQYRESSSSDGGNNNGLAVGLGIGIGCGVLLIAFIALLVYRKKREDETPKFVSTSS
jgi:hypothetical protein